MALISILASPCIIPFRELTSDEREFRLLSWLVGDETAGEIVRQNESITKDTNIATIPDSFFDPMVKFNVLVKYCTKSAFQIISTKIKEGIKSWRCGTCKRKMGKGRSTLFANVAYFGAITTALDYLRNRLVIGFAQNVSTKVYTVRFVNENVNFLFHNIYQPPRLHGHLLLQISSRFLRDRGVRGDELEYLYITICLINI